MKYEKATAIVVAFDNSDVVTESGGSENGGYTFDDAQDLIKKCSMPSLTITCGSQAGDALFNP